LAKRKLLTTRNIQMIIPYNRRGNNFGNCS